MGMTVESLRFAINKIQSQIEVIGEEMNVLDGQLGDGDLGITLIKGYNAIGEIGSKLPDDLGAALIQCTQAMTMHSASSYGTLTATAFMAVGKELKGQTEVEWSRFSELANMALQAVMARGGASLGDKTVLDPLHAIVVSTDGVSDPNELADKAGVAVASTLEDFRGRPCKVGRARMFEEKSTKLDDPGSVALLRLVDCLRSPPTS